MGTMTVTDLVDEVRQSLGNRSEVTDARIVRILNISQIRIARKMRWEELEQTTTGNLSFTGSAVADKYYALAANIRKVHSFRLTSSSDTSKIIKLEYVPPALWDKRIGSPEAFSTNKPRWYTQWKRRLEFFPAPDDDYAFEMRHTNWPTAFTTSTMSATSDLDNKDDLLVALTNSWYFMTLRQRDSANTWWAIYKDLALDAGYEESDHPDMGQKAESDYGNNTVADYWNDPFSRGAP